MAWNELVGITALIYALANPIGVIPIFLGFTHKLRDARSSRIIFVASTAVAGFLIVSVLLGAQTLAFFNVGLDDFRIASGLLDLFIAFEMFQARYGGIMQTLDEKHEAEADVHAIAITPLAFPLLVGPAEMSIMITLVSDAHDAHSKVMLVAVSAIASVLIAGTLWLSAPIERIIGKTGINVATRVMALIVASIAIKFIITGIKNQMPGLMH